MPWICYSSEIKYCQSQYFFLMLSLLLPSRVSLSGLMYSEYWDEIGEVFMNKSCFKFFLHLATQEVFTHRETALRCVRNMPFVKWENDDYEGGGGKDTLENGDGRKHIEVDCLKNMCLWTSWRVFPCPQGSVYPRLKNACLIYFVPLPIRHYYCSMQSVFA